MPKWNEMTRAKRLHHVGLESMVVEETIEMTIRSFVTEILLV
jgi:hypothetical protein